jgi:peptidyl-prolyl cis-trans isomerase D
MLRGIHKASANWLGRIVMGIVLGLIAISFGIWGIGDIFRGFGQSTVATVGNTEIRIDQFRQLYQDRLQQLGRNLGRPILPDQARALGLDRQLLMQVIAETVVDEQARALRLGISDAEIARRITEDPNFKTVTGRFDRLRFEQALRNAGYTEARFVAEQRRNALRKQLIGTIGGDVTVPKAAIEAFNRFQNEERTIEYVSLGREQAGDIPAPTPEVLAKYFEERKVLFRAPEYRKILIVELTPDELASTIEVSDADVKKAYEERKARYVTPERRHVKQIVFPSMEEARAAADKIAKGTTFEALATERNLKESDIDLGTIAKSAIVDRAVADAAFALKIGEVSAPVEGRFGIALVQVVGIEPAQTKPLDQVANELKRELALERAKNEVQNIEEKIEDERLGGASLADAARKFNLKPRTIEAVDRSGRDPDGKVIADLPKGADVLTAAFAAEVGGDNEPLRVSGGGHIWYDVLDIKPSRERSLDQVKDRVLARWRDDEIAARLKSKATLMLDQLKAGKTFAEVAAAHNLKVEWRPGIKRSSPPPGLPAHAIEEIFRTPKDAASSVDGASPAERLVFRVTEDKVPPLDPQSGDAKRIEEALRRGMADDIVSQYVARLQSDIGFRINQSALNQVTGGGTNY